MDKILLLSPQHYIAPLDNGGAIRSFNLLGQLAQAFDVTAVVPSNSVEARREADARGWRLRVVAPQEYKTMARHKGWSGLWTRFQMQYGLYRYRRAARRWQGNPFQHVYAPVFHWYPLLDSLARELTPDCVILGYLAHISTLAYLRRKWPRARYVLDAPDVESRKIRRYVEALGDESHGQFAHLNRQCKWILDIESSLSTYAEAFWACSREDYLALAQMNPGMPGLVVPNGVDTDYFAFDDNPQKQAAPELIYIGSLSYPPSDEALFHFYQETWPVLQRERPEITFTIVGHGATPRLKQWVAQDSHITLAESVPDVRPYLQQAALTVVPLQVGTGTRLKILESMSVGNPVISTTIGAEGLDTIDGVHLLIADEPNAFAQAVLRLLDDTAMYKAVQLRAREFVETNFDWKVIGQAVVQWVAGALVGHEATVASVSGGQESSP